jgi:hypothetical protein
MSLIMMMSMASRILMITIPKPVANRIIISPFSNKKKMHCKN